MQIFHIIYSMNMEYAEILGQLHSVVQFAWHMIRLSCIISTLQHLCSTYAHNYQLDAGAGLLVPDPGLQPKHIVVVVVGPHHKVGLMSSRLEEIGAESQGD